MTFSLMLIVVGLILIWAVGIEPRWYRLKRISVPLGLPASSPLTILLLTDMHFPIFRRSLERYFCGMLSKLRPDLILIGGDMIDNDRGIEPCLRALSRLKANLGVYAVLGNHDYYIYNMKEIFLFNTGFKATPCGSNDVVRLKRGLEGIGCRILQNDSVRFETGKGIFEIIGIDDAVTEKADVRQAFRDVKGDGLKILLTHSIDVLAEKFPSPAHLALAGHTHGGQMSIPLFGNLPLWNHCRLGRKYGGGAAKHGNTFTYTSRGLGVGNLFFFRLFCRPEAVWVEVL